MWYVVHSKPREELRALENLSIQGFKCFLPTLNLEKVVRRQLKTVTVPMFSRYFFVQSDSENQNFSLIRSTKGVSKLLSFGALPCEVPNKVIETLRSLVSAHAYEFQAILKSGDPVYIIDGPLRGLNAIFKEPNGDLRAYVLLDLLNKTHQVEVQRSDLVPSKGQYSAC